MINTNTENCFAINGLDDLCLTITFAKIVEKAKVKNHTEMCGHCKQRYLTIERDEHFKSCLKLNAQFKLAF